MIRSTIIFAVISIFSHASAFEHKGKYDVSDLKPFLENFKTVMKTGNASFHIPVLDPHDVKDELYHVVLSFITADLHLKNLHMVGFSDYQVKEGRFELDTLDVVMDLHWDNINVRSDYDIDGVLGNRFLGNDKIYGNGKFT
ncbi:hypothetical protein M0802_007836 [Mischocyttarus mexicanus]|nr:hypothetical protein M0802_007836 [Mischocyttarus mexicanus]